MLRHAPHTTRSRNSSKGRNFFGAMKYSYNTSKTRRTKPTTIIEMIGVLPQPRCPDAARLNGSRKQIMPMHATTIPMTIDGAYISILPTTRCEPARTVKISQPKEYRKEPGSKSRSFALEV